MHLLYTVAAHGGLLVLVGVGAPALIWWAETRATLDARLRQITSQGADDER